VTRLTGLDDALLERAVDRLLGFEPEATAVLATGSYAKGTAGAGSDLDLTAITPSPRDGYRMWFEDALHVSVDAKTADAWLARAAAPARWSLGFPAENTAVYVQADDATRARLGPDPSQRHPAAGPELEDFVDFVLKAKRLAAAGDEVGLRWHAQGAAALAPTLLIPLNEERVVRDRRDALDAALSFAVAPEHYAEDIAICFGVVGGDSRAAVARLGRELLAFLRERAPGVDDQPEIGRYLADGTLERHLEAM